jgi:hypothetical protein
VGWLGGRVDGRMGAKLGEPITPLEISISSSYPSQKSRRMGYPQRLVNCKLGEIIEGAGVAERGEHPTGYRSMVVDLRVVPEAARRESGPTTAG